MIKRATEKNLSYRVIDLARNTRQKIDAASLKVTNIEGVAELLELNILSGDLADGQDGSYIKNKRQIILSTTIPNIERMHFTFCHEVMHSVLEDDDDFLNDFADAFIADQDSAMERLCNIGAAELLMPASEIRSLAFLVGLIPTLCETYQASSIAAAFQLVNSASHACYLLIAEPQVIWGNDKLPLLPQINQENQVNQLQVVYTGKSAVAKYLIRNRITLPYTHEICAALEKPNIVLNILAHVPIGRNPWPLACEVLYFRKKIFAVFNQGIPVSQNQLPLL